MISAVCASFLINDDPACNSDDPTDAQNKLETEIDQYIASWETKPKRKDQRNASFKFIAESYPDAYTFNEVTGKITKRDNPGTDQYKSLAKGVFFFF